MIVTAMKQNILGILMFSRLHGFCKGRKELNFSTFATYEPKRQAHKLYEAAEMVQTDKMPLDSYVLGHPEANFSEAEKKELIEYFQLLESDIRVMNNLPSELKK